MKKTITTILIALALFIGLGKIQINHVNAASTSLTCGFCGTVYSVEVTDCMALEASGKCPTCGNDNFGSIPDDVRPHHMVVDSVMEEPSCNGPGLATVVCDICYNADGEIELPALGHDFATYTVTNAATCTAAGSEASKCSRCDETNTRAIAALGHNFATYSVTTAATCTASGTETSTCTRCTQTNSRSIAALGHNYSAYTVTTAATCTASGVETSTCSRCNDKQTRTIAALGHNYGAYTVTTAATCTASGVETSTCSRCNDKQTRTIAALGHNYSAFKTTKSATCTEAGSQESVCSRCNDKKTQTVSALGHNYSAFKTTKEATCTETGTKESVCSRCSDKKTETISALGHSLSEWEVEKEAKCEEEGLQKKDCSRCEYTEEQVIEALSHKASEFVVTKEPTCLEKGERTSICELCDTHFTEEIEALGHSFGAYELVEKPSLGKEGKEEATCSVCLAKEDRPLAALTLPEFIEENPGVAVGAGAGTVGVTGVLFFLLKKKSAEATVVATSKVAETVATASAASKVVETTATVTAASESSSLAGVAVAAGATAAGGFALEKLETKIIEVVLTDSEQANKLVSLFRKMPYLEVTTHEAGLEELNEVIGENESDLVVFDISCGLTLDEIEEFIDSVNEELDDDAPDFAITGSQKDIEANSSLLYYLEESEKVSKVTYYEKLYGAFTDLVLPLYKPEINVENSLEGISSVASLLGFDTVAAIADAVSEGLNIKDLLSQDETSGRDKLDIIVSICNIIGIDIGQDTITDIEDTIDDLAHKKKKVEENTIDPLREAKERRQAKNQEAEDEENVDSQEDEITSESDTTKEND